MGRYGVLTKYFLPHCATKTRVWPLRVGHPPCWRGDPAMVHLYEVLGVSSLALQGEANEPTERCDLVL